MWLRELLAAFLRRLARVVAPARLAASPDPPVVDQLITLVAHELTAMEAATQLWASTDLCYNEKGTLPVPPCAGLNPPLRLLSKSPPNYS